MAEMIDLFLRDLAHERGEKEPDSERDQTQFFQRHRYGRELNYQDIDILERILTEYNLNPHPRVLFVVEGKTEEVAIPIICEAMGIRLETFSIALHNIAGVTHGERRNLSILTRFVAPPRLGAPIKPGLYPSTRQTQGGAS